MQNAGMTAQSVQLSALAAEDLAFDRTALELESDDEGHFEPSGREIALGDDPMRRACETLRAGTGILLTARNSELYFSVSFARCVEQPHIMVAWSTMMFAELDGERRGAYRKLIARLAAENASNVVVIVVDPPGYFEDSIVDIDGDCYVSTLYAGERVAAVQEVWTANRTIQVEGFLLAHSGEIGAFQRFIAKPKQH